jgi:hypothetical protein
MSRNRSQRSRLLGTALLMILGGLGPNACSCGRGSDQPSVFTTHEFEASATATLQLGLDCSIGGNAACLPFVDAHGSTRPAICLHYLPNPSSGWVCAPGTCETSADCPGPSGSIGAWGCVQLVPGWTDSAVCAPPGNFRPTLVTVPAAVAAPVRPAPPASPPGAWLTSPDAGSK